MPEKKHRNPATDMGSRRSRKGIRARDQSFSERRTMARPPGLLQEVRGKRDFVWTLASCKAEQRINERPLLRGRHR